MKILLILILFTTLFGDRNLINIQYNNPNLNTKFNKIVKDDNNYYLSMNITNSSTAINFLKIVKLNLDKELVDEVTIPNSTSNSLIENVELVDNFIYITYEIFEEDDYRTTVIMKLDKELNFIDQRNILRDKKIEQSLDLKYDEEYIYVIGSMNKPYLQSEKRYPHMIKLDKQLNVVDSVKGEPRNYLINDFTVRDDKIITIGSTNSSGNCFIREYNKEFYLLSETPLDLQHLQLIDIEEDEDNYLIASVVSTGENYVSSSIIKFDSQFVLIDEIIFGTEFGDIPLKVMRFNEKVVSIGMYHGDFMNPNNLFNAGITILDNQLNYLNSYYFGIDPDNSSFSSGIKSEELTLLLVGHNNGLGWILETDLEGNYNPNVTVGVEENNNPESTALLRNYPNPFNPTTTITYSIDSDSEVKLVVMDIMGREIGSFSQGVVSTGTHSIVFDGSNLATGVYLYTLIVDGVTRVSEKMVLVR